jgi:SAM-dependent methyltransferase
MRCSPTYSRLAPHYDAIAGFAQFTSVRRIFEHALRRYRLRFRRVADFGCGTGLFVRYICSCGAELVYGIDRSVPMLEIARLRETSGRTRFLCCDFTSVRLACPVDLVTTFSFTLNLSRNLDELRRLIRAAWRNLAPGGAWLFDCLVPFRDGRRLLKLRFTLPDAGGELFTENHVARFFSPWQIGAELRRAGFVLLDVFDYLTLGEPRRSSPALVFLACKPGGEPCI